MDDLDKYDIVIRPEVYVMLDVIYRNICERAIDDSAAEHVINAIEEGILSLKIFPKRGSDVTDGMYANKGYKKLIIKNHIIIYRIVGTKDGKKVIVVFVKPEKMNI